MNYAKELLLPSCSSPLDYPGMTGRTLVNEGALVLSGGGIDSFVSALMYKTIFNELVGDSPRFLFVCFDYGQATFNVERIMAERQAQYFNGDLLIVQDNLRDMLKNNALVDRTAAKKDDNQATFDDYVPNRNARFLITAAGIAEIHKLDTIVFGAVGSVNIDNSLQFIEAAQKTMRTSNRDLVPNIYAPFVMQTKAMVALMSDDFKIPDLEDMTTSCFNTTDMEDGTYVVQCGKCRSCTSLKQAFHFAGVVDPYVYASE